MANINNQQKISADTLSKMIDLLGLSAEQECNFDDRCIVLNLRSEDPGRLIGRNGQTIDALQTLINKMLRRHEDDFPPIVIDVDGYKRTRRTRRGRKDGEESDTQQDAPASERPRRERGEGRGENRGEGRGEGRGRRQNRNEERGERGERREGGGQSRLSDDRAEAIKRQAIEASKEAKRWGEEVTLPPMSNSERRLIHLTLKDDPQIITESGTDMPDGKKRVIVRSK